MINTFIQNLEFSKIGLASLGIAGFFTVFLMLIAVILFVSLLVYLYKAYAWYTIAKKLKYDKAWLAWIPIAQFFLFPILAKKNWEWGFIILAPFVFAFIYFIPFIGSLFLSIISLGVLAIQVYWTWLIFQRRKYEGCFSLFQIVPFFGDIAHMIVLGFVAWKDKPKKAKSKK
jgi:hypothetical protein